jgi:uncharacterized protein with von Willebrand factor type A (vWA) domain
MIWLQRIKDRFPDAIWLNPLPRRSWNYVNTIKIIRDIFPMFELTLEGLDEGVKYLMTGKSSIYKPGR